jgi:hypothetical protein
MFSQHPADLVLQYFNMASDYMCHRAMPPHARHSRGLFTCTRLARVDQDLYDSVGDALYAVEALATWLGSVGTRV